MTPAFRYDFFVAVLTLAISFGESVEAASEVPKSGRGVIAAEAPAPGTYASLPPGVHAVTGTCSGAIAITPFIPYLAGKGSAYPAVYDCESKTFEVLSAPANHMSLADLTQTEDGFYFYSNSFENNVFEGQYALYDLSGKLRRVLFRPNDAKVHDMILRGREITYIRYVPDWDASSCGRGVPLEVEVVTEDQDGNQLWTWTSKGRLNREHNVGTDGSMHVPQVGRLRRFFRSVRNCYSSLARNLFTFDTPSWFLSDDKVPMLAIDLDDYVHVNSIQWLEPSGNLLVVSRHLELIFQIDPKSGEIVWSLGGRFATATRERPVGDPRGGFSHPHYARIVGNKLWVFDNANLFNGLPSRAVAYQLDSKPPNRLVFEFAEPNGRQRYSLGSVEAIDDDHLLIGWGAVNPQDMAEPQRAASIVRISDGKETFAMDMKPSWISYRAKMWRP